MRRQRVEWRCILCITSQPSVARAGYQEVGSLFEGRGYPKMYDVLEFRKINKIDDTSMQTSKK